LEQTNLPKEHYDLIVSNVPFGEVPIYDSNLDKKYLEAADNIHNYFFAKSIALAKPGGMIAFLTSRFTLDSQNTKLRQLINDNCLFCGAVRLPDTAFANNAGTEVVTDLIFLKKFALGEERNQRHDFMHVKSVPYTDESGQSGMLSYNEYYYNHPEQMLGTLEFGGLYNKEGLNLKGDKNISLKEAIISIADKIFPEPVLRAAVADTMKKQTGKNGETNYSIRLDAINTIGNIVVMDDGFAGVITEEYYIDEAMDEAVQSLGISPYTVRYNPESLTSAAQSRIAEAGIDIKDLVRKQVEVVNLRKEDLPKAKLYSEIRYRAKELIYKESEGYPDTHIQPPAGTIVPNLFAVC
jgi:hypothetical protein